MTESNPPNPPKRTRNAEATQKRILKAAKKEFARFGLAGARIDTIADNAKANKRMIYHYFSDKETLFQHVLEDAYDHMRSAEKKLELDQLPPKEALIKLVEFTWNYYVKNPEFVPLVNSANLHKAAHLKNSERFRAVNADYLSQTSIILDRGVKAGVFRSDIDPLQLTITIAAMTYYYHTNRYTLSLIFDTNLASDQNMKARYAHVLNAILSIVCHSTND